MVRYPSARRESNVMLRNHPCFSPGACHSYSRIHLPVAPRCNIQCNYCNRRFDCHNECRPGVTSRVVKPQEALKLVKKAVEKMPHLRVVGVAGPGDPLANDETFEALKLIHERYPELTLCLSTNGLLISEKITEILDAGVRFVTVTVNAVDPEVGRKIYSWVINGREILRGREAAEVLIAKQLKGISELVEEGAIVKVNTIVCPTVNDQHIPEVAKRIRELGVHVMNIAPLIPVGGTPFADLNPPTAENLDMLREACGAYVRQIWHCRQCRSDAVGFIGCASTISDDTWGLVRIAVATTNGLNVDKQFGAADTFWIYDASPAGYKLIDKRRVRQYCFSKVEDNQPNATIEDLLDCQVVVCSAIGHRPRQELLAKGIEPVEFSGTIGKVIDMVVSQRFMLSARCDGPSYKQDQP